MLGLSCFKRTVRDGCSAVAAGALNIVCLLSGAPVARRWPSFYRGGSVAFYIGLYSIGFLFNTLHLQPGSLSVVLYLSYMGLTLWAMYLAMATVGFVSSFYFTYQIFSAVKAD